MKKKVMRNRGCAPFLTTEGHFEKPLIPGGRDKEELVCGSDKLKPYERMHMHHTLASARRYAPFKPHKNLIPMDVLDLKLSSNFDQSNEVFPDLFDVYIQPETLDIKDTWRRLRNTKDIEPDRDSKEYLQQFKSETGGDETDEKQSIPFRYNFAHPVLISGIIDRRHPSNVKLMNCSHHLPQTNAGYSRQDSDGNVFQY